MLKYKRIPLETLVNVRDLGGFAAMEGKITKYGVFLRSDCPTNITPYDLQFLLDYGITLTIDLRGNDEVQKTPSALSQVAGLTYIHCPISADHSVLQSGNKELPLSPQDGNFDLGDTYIEIAETAKAWVKRVFTICAQWQGGVMYHCFLGKDRTGIITALLLGACGVSDTDILMDYSASMSCLRPRYSNMHPEMLPQKRGRPDYCWGFFGSVPESMEALLCHLQAKYGGVTAYLQSCGVSTQSIRKLQQKLLE
ncbi:MAG: tyrosine-protein phosphatase [Firmicutes bacterium]|nr:tyrosine-protein phosphatase [Bacillota bacterium]